MKKIVVPTNHLQPTIILPPPCKAATVQGHFIDNNTILISKYHVHSPMRDIYSKIGISMLTASWLLALFDKRIRIV